jgi:hypothetical protein
LAAGTVLGLDGERRGFGRKEVAGAAVEVLFERRGGKRTESGLEQGDVTLSAPTGRPNSRPLHVRFGPNTLNWFIFQVFFFL